LKKKSLAIGVFDSGMGGLTVLKALRSVLPSESFIYLGDTARLPYGTKSAITVKQYAFQMARILIEREIKALVLACNTATTAALPHLQQMLPDIPVMGVVAPGAAAAVSATSNQRIVVLATETTISSNAYQNIIRQQLPQSVVTGHSCSLLVALAEEGMVSNEVAMTVMKHYLQLIQDEDTILLGCTHFPVFKQLMRSMLPSNIKIVDSAEATAQAFKTLLKEKKLLTAENHRSGSICYLATDSVERFTKVGSLFLDESLLGETVELVDATTVEKELGNSGNTIELERE